jgi:hypothetical protein
VLIQLVEVGEGEKMNQIEDGCELSYQFAFHVLQLLPILFTQQNLCCKQIYDEPSANIGLKNAPLLI